MSTQTSSSDVKTAAPVEDFVLQYLAVRKDLTKTLKWPLGSLLTQAAHAAVAAVVSFPDHPDVRYYTSAENLPHMRKITVACDSEADLLALAQRLTEAGVDHNLWVRAFTTAHDVLLYRFGLVG